MYPPPKAPSIECVVYSALNHKIILLSSDHVLYTYIIKPGTTVLQEMITADNIVDDSGYSLKSAITCIEMFREDPPSYDKYCFEKRKQGQDADAAEKDDEYLALGLQTGTVAILSIRLDGRVRYRN